MLKKLKSVLESPKGLLLLSILKAFAFSGLLAVSDAGWIWAALFLFGACYFYFKNASKAKDFLPSFLILLVTAFISNKLLLAAHPSLGIGGAAFFGILFFVLMGVKNLNFVHRTIPYYFLNSLLFGAVFILFFYSDQPHFFTLKYLSLGLAAFLLFREFLGFDAEAQPSSTHLLFLAKNNLLALVSAFLTLEIAWAVSLLPIGFLNSASSLLLFILIIDDLLLHCRSGTINRRVILGNVTIFLLINVVIFLFSKWQP